VFGQIHLLFLDRADETLRVAILPGLALIGHADLDLGILTGPGCRPWPPIGFPDPNDALLAPDARPASPGQPLQSPAAGAGRLAAVARR
jgi:hypothetical protein